MVEDDDTRLHHAVNTPSDPYIIIHLLNLFTAGMQPTAATGEHPVYMHNQRSNSQCGAPHVFGGMHP